MTLQLFLVTTPHLLDADLRDARFMVLVETKPTSSTVESQSATAQATLEGVATAADAKQTVVAATTSAPAAAAHRAFGVGTAGVTVGRASQATIPAIVLADENVNWGRPFLGISCCNQPLCSSHS